MVRHQCIHMLTSVEFALALIYKFNSEVHWNAESQGTFVKLGHLMKAG